MAKNFDFKKLSVAAKWALGGVKKLLWIIGNHAFWATLILILVDIIAGGIIYFQAVYLADMKTAEINSSYFQFKDSIYQQVLAQWQSRSQNLDDSLKKNYNNPF